MSRLSIIIPFDDEISVEAFEETLASVLLCRPEESDILVVTRNLYDDPWETGKEGVVFLHCPESRSLPALLNRAVRAAQGEIVHILHPGIEATPGWTDDVLPHFEASKVGIVIPCLHDRRKPKRVFSLGICYHSSGVLRTLRRSRLSEVSRQTVIPHVAAVFFRRSALASVDFLDETFLPQLAFAEAALAMKTLGWETVLDAESRIMVRPNRLPASRHFVWGMQQERLYFRRLGRETSFWTLGRHFASFFSDVYRHFPKPSAFRLLMGRLAGLFFFGEILRPSPQRETRGAPLSTVAAPLPCPPLSETDFEDAAAKKIA